MFAVAGKADCVCLMFFILFLWHTYAKNKHILLLAATTNVANMFCEGLRLLIACSQDLTRKSSGGAGDSGSTPVKSVSGTSSLSKDEWVKVYVKVKVK